MTKIIGLTGGIGSGKTTVAKMFMEKGVPVYIADDKAKKVMESQMIIKQIKNAFGGEVISNKSVDRVKLAQIVFNKPDKLEILNKIIHPAVQKNFKEWLKLNETAPFVMKEAAILFETGGYKQCDKIITVVAPKIIRLERVIRRDKVDEISVQQRMNNQWTDEKKIELSDFVIENIDLEQTKIQVENIFKKLNKV
ncbi:dephospho-CoA kinase [Flavobacterium sp.]|uniref:dephospho-CoA kinase n=1 Tax=Flavobacterium sp. TaxID=239 RepID=UPI00352807EC